MIQPALVSNAVLWAKRGETLRLRVKSSNSTATFGMSLVFMRCSFSLVLLFEYFFSGSDPLFPVCASLRRKVWCRKVYFRRTDFRCTHLATCNWQRHFSSTYENDGKFGTDLPQSSIKVESFSLHFPGSVAPLFAQAFMSSGGESSSIFFVAGDVF